MAVEVRKRGRNVARYNQEEIFERPLYLSDKVYLQGRVVTVGDGKNTDFWCDKWCDNFSQCEKFKKLCDICHEKKIAAAEMGNRNCVPYFQKMAPRKFTI